MIDNRLFDVCLDRDKRNIMLKAIDIYLEKMRIESRSKILIREAEQLKNDIESMNICY